MDMNRVEELTRHWLELREYCTLDEYDPKVFAMKAKNMVDRYKRMTMQEQGEFITNLITEMDKEN